jgi:hypothetical protein
MVPFFFSKMPLSVANFIRLFWMMQQQQPSVFARVQSSFEVFLLWGPYIQLICLLLGFLLDNAIVVALSNCLCVSP